MSKLDKHGNIDISSPNVHLKSGVKDGTFKESKTYSKGKFGTSSIFAFIILILFAIVFSHFIRTGTFINFSFKSLIEYLGNLPDVSFKFSQVDLTIYSDWGIFNFLRDFINFAFLDFAEFSFALSGLVLQGFVVIGYLVGLFFI